MTQTTGTIELTATSRCYGNSGQYIARINGRDSKYTYNRAFVGRKSDRSTTAIIDEPGIFEECDIDKKGRKDMTYVYACPRTADTPPLRENANPTWMRIPMAESDVMVATKRLDAGESIEDILVVVRDGDSYTYTVRSKVESKKASAAVTINTATEQCWQILQSLPEREAKKVLAALKVRVAPKPAAEPVALDAAAESTSTPNAPEESAV